MRKGKKKTLLMIKQVNMMLMFEGNYVILQLKGDGYSFLKVVFVQ